MTKLKINNLFNIKKKICVVSGANGGLGSKIVKGLLLNGAIVIGIDIKTTKNIQSKNFQFIKVDLTKKKETHKLFVFIKKKFKKIDSIINICGVSDPNNFNNNIDVNLIAPFNLINSLQNYYLKKIVQLLTLPV